MNDDYLFDYIFQPIVNRLMMHPLDVAGSTAIGAVVFLAMSALTQISFASLGTSVMMLLAVAGQIMVVLVFIRALNGLRPLIKPYLRNPLRDRLFSVRLAAFAINGAFFGLLMIASNIPMILIWIGQFLWCAAMYFECCDIPPIKPLPQRSHHSFSTS